jgi:hypothetical protein
MALGGLPTGLDTVLHQSPRWSLNFGKIHPDAALGCSITPTRIDPNTQEIDMNLTIKKLVVAVAVTAFTVLGVAAPASAARVQYKTVWCC